MTKSFRGWLLQKIGIESSEIEWNSIRWSKSDKERLIALALAGVAFAISAVSAEAFSPVMVITINILILIAIIVGLVVAGFVCLIHARYLDSC